MVNALMDLVKSPLKMVINIKVNFIMVYYMVKVNLSGVMESNIKANLPIIESQVMVYIDGLMVVFIKDK